MVFANAKLGGLLRIAPHVSALNASMATATTALVFASQDTRELTVVLVNAQISAMVDLSVLSLF